MPLLIRHHSSVGDVEEKVQVSWKIEKGYFSVNFEVRTPQCHINPKMKRESWDNWGLWEHDVVELFIQKRGSIGQAYLELQVSPLGQKFALLVKKPRLKFRKISPLNIQVTVDQLESGFRGEFKVNFEDIPGNGAELWGNMHACLGPKEKRRFYSLNPWLKGEKPDFHRPHSFIHF